MTLNSSNRQSSAPPTAVKQAPAYRPTSPTHAGSRAVFLDFNHAPSAIVDIMDDAKLQATAFTTKTSHLKKQLRWLYLVGLLFVGLDFVLGYNYFTFTLVCAGIWLLALFGSLMIKRQGKAPEFDSKFDLTRTVLDTLECDVASKQTMMGWLDLTGFENEGKEYRQKKSISGRPIVYYRDEWLKMKAKLYDGNVLRVGLIEKVKDRQGFYKRSAISGKQKWKAGSTHKTHQLSVSVTANPDGYTVVPFDGLQMTDSRFMITDAVAENGRITVKAITDKEYDAWDVLHALKFCYKQVQPIENPYAKTTI